MTQYLSVTDYANKHGIDVSNVRRAIYNSKLPAIKIGNQWAIPADAPKPEDKRVKSGKYAGWRKQKPEAE